MELVEDDIGGFGPDEGLGVIVVLVDVAVDGGLEIDDGLEGAAADAPAGEDGEEALYGVEPGGGGGREVEGPSRVARQPGAGLGMFVGPVVVENDMDDLSGGDLALDRVQEADELLMRMLLHAAAEDHPVEDVEGGEQGGGSVALVVMGHRRAFAGLDRQTRLGPIQRLDLALFVDGQHHGVMGRAHVEADDVLDLLGEGGVLGPLEGAPAVGLQIVCLPDALYGSERQVHGLGHGPAGPVGDLARRLGAGERQNLGHYGRRRGRLSRLAAPLAQKPVDAALGVMPLPAPHRRSADVGSPRHFQRRQSVGGMQDDPGALHVFERPASVASDRGQAHAVLGGDDHRNGLGHTRRLARSDRIVNPLNTSVH